MAAGGGGENEAKKMSGCVSGAMKQRNKNGGAINIAAKKRKDQRRNARVAASCRRVMTARNIGKHGGGIGMAWRQRRGGSIRHRGGSFGGSAALAASNE
jgi:hypothetical protein